MKILSSPPSNAWELSQFYNGLDCCVTHAVHGAMPAPPSIYQFSLDLQGPLLEMMLRGVRIDHKAKWEIEQGLAHEVDQYQGILAELCAAVGFPFSEKLANSTGRRGQVARLFYDHMRLPEIRYAGKTKTDRDALERLQAYRYARPIVACILGIRERQKLLSVLRKCTEERIRTSYNIGGTDTGRLSSSAPAFGPGDNLQNWTELLRRIVIADPGMKLAYVDLEQAESRIVAYLSGDEAYIEACESGDIHTAVAYLVWPEFFPGGPDKARAELPFYRHFSRRYLAKRGGHGSNYYGQPPTMAKHLHVPTPVVADFQQRYFKRFPGIPRWHAAVAERIATTGTITTCFGRERQFFGRPNDDATLRQAIAHEPQSTIADVLNSGLLQLWRAQIPGVQLLLQVHDAVLIQYPEEVEDTVVPLVCEKILFPIAINGRRCTIPCEAQVGWNWQHFDKDSNPDGLKEWTGHDTRARVTNPEASILDRLIC